MYRFLLQILFVLIIINNVNTSIKKIFPNVYGFYLFLLVIFHLFFNFIWQRINSAPPTWDSAGHLVLSFIFADKFALLARGLTDITSILKVSVYYPPFVHIFGGTLIYLFGRSYEIPLFFIETGFFILSIIMIYKIVLIKFPSNYKLAFFTAFIFSFFPQIWEQSRYFHLDIPLLGLLLLSYYYLLKSDLFNKPIYSFLFFISFSLVQLTKWYGFVFLLSRW